MSYDRFMGLMWGIPAGICFALASRRIEFAVIGALLICAAVLLQPRGR